MGYRSSSRAELRAEADFQQQLEHASIAMEKLATYKSALGI
jgi:hypothetical protein